jgi:hypothetical protein
MIANDFAYLKTLYMAQIIVKMCCNHRNLQQGNKIDSTIFSNPKSAVKDDTLDR